MAIDAIKELEEAVIEFGNVVDDLKILQSISEEIQKAGSGIAESQAHIKEMSDALSAKTGEITKELKDKTDEITKELKDRTEKIAETTEKLVAVSSQFEVNTKTEIEKLQGLAQQLNVELKNTSTRLENANAKLSGEIVEHMIKLSESVRSYTSTVQRAVDEESIQLSDSARELRREIKEAQKEESEKIQFLEAKIEGFQQQYKESQTLSKIGSIAAIIAAVAAVVACVIR